MRRLKLMAAGGAGAVTIGVFNSYDPGISGDERFALLWFIAGIGFLAAALTGTAILNELKREVRKAN
jgi:hypothetical protein